MEYLLICRFNFGEGGSLTCCSEEKLEVSESEITYEGEPYFLNQYCTIQRHIFTAFEPALAKCCSKRNLRLYLLAFISNCLPI